MSIQWADDFSRYGTGSSSRSAMLDGLPYAILGSTGNGGEVVADPDTNITGRAYYLGASSNDWKRDFRVALPTVITTNTLGMVLRFYVASLPGADNARPTPLQFQNGSGTIILMARIEQNGSITVHGLVSSVLSEVADTVNPAVQPASWNHYEMIHNNSTGAGSLYLNGVQILTWTGVDTGESLELVNSSRRNGSTEGSAGYIKDFVVWDGTGSQNNSLLGTVIVRRLNPNADSSLGGWTPSTGTTGFNLLAKDAPDDANYMSADGTPPAAMLYDLENLPADVTSVKALLSVVRMQKVDGGDATVQAALSPNGTNFDLGADRPITSAFSYYFDVSELDPATATAWSPSAVDSAVLRINRTT